MPAARPRWLLVVVSVLTIVVGLVETVRRAWVCDDVFISFRYVDQLLAGNGLVFNPGERVEGYTHFLWVMVLAAFHRLGIDLVVLGRYLPILFFAATLAVLVGRSWRRGAGLGLPLAAWGLALHYDVQLFASSGLETAPFGLLLLLGLLEVTAARPRYGLAGALYALATLMRPEGALYTASAGLYVLWRTRALRAGLGFAGAWLALVVPSMLFRIAYYGEVLPNTFYAKSGAAANWPQGWHYTRLYFGTYLVLLAALVAVPLGWGLRWRAGRRARVAAPDDSVVADAQPAPVDMGRGNLDPATLAGVQVLLTVLYVTRLGGDFMFARFYIPATILLYLVLEDVLRCLRWRWVEVVAAVLLIALTLQARLPRARTFVGREKVQGIVDEANYYTAETLATLRHQGEVLGKFLSDTPARVGLLSGQDAVAYFGHLPYALEGQGLTDAELAHMPITARGRPGHERPATPEFLLRRRIHFRLRYGMTVNLALHRQIRFDDLYGEMIHYDTALMRQLAGRAGISFVPFPYFLEDYMRKLGDRQPRRLLEDYIDFRTFYFAFNPDPERLERYRAALLSAGIPEAHLQEAERMARQSLVAAGIAP